MAVSISISITQNSQSVPNNTSNVTVKVTAKWTYGSWNANSKPGWLTIDGTKYTFSSNFNTGQSTSGSKVLFTKTVDVPHSADGSKTLNCSASYTSGVSSGTVTASASKALTKIARKSSISAVTASELGNESTIEVSRQSTSFTHTLTYECGTASGTIVTKSSEISISWTPPLSLASQNTAGTALTITFTLETFNDDTSMGTMEWISYAYSIPDSIAPSASLDVADVFSYRGTYGAYVQGKSKLKIDITAAGVYGSTIKSYKTTIDGKTYTTASVETEIISGSGEMTITTTVTDSRGRTKTATWDIEVLPYMVPQITALKVNRSDANGAASVNGSYLAVTFSSVIAALENQNTAAYTLQYKKVTESSYTSVTLTSYAGQYSVSNGVYVFAADAVSYDIILTAADGIDSASKAGNGPSLAKRWSYFKKNLGIAFGKIAELADVFDVGIAAKFRSTVALSNNKFVFAEDAGGVERNLFGLNASNNLLIGYDLYDKNLGNAVVYGNDVRVNAKNKIHLNSPTVFPNGGYIAGTDTNGNVIGMLTPVNADNACVLGYGGYVNSVGATEIYGKDVKITSIEAGLTNRSYGVNKVLWSGGHYMAADHTATFSEPVSAQPNGIVLIWSAYTASSSTVNDYRFHSLFIPKSAVANASGCGWTQRMTDGAWNAVAGKYFYVFDTHIKGHDNNKNSGSGSGGVAYDNKGYVLRWVIGV